MLKGVGHFNDTYNANNIGVIKKRLALQGSKKNNKVQ